MSVQSLNLKVLAERLAVCRLAPDAPVPGWATTRQFFTVSRTHEELSVVCEQDLVPQDVKAERDWACFQVCGPLDFALVGILAALANTLAAAKISIFAVSTYDTDYLLVQHRDLEAAVNALRDTGHRVSVDQL